MQTLQGLTTIVLEPKQIITCPPEILFLANKEKIFIGLDGQDIRITFHSILGAEKILTSRIKNTIELPVELVSIEYHYNVMGFYLLDPGNGGTEKRVDCELLCFPTVGKGIVVKAEVV